MPVIIGSCNEKVYREGSHTLATFSPEHQPNGSLPAVPDGMTVALAHGFDRSLSPVDKRTDAGARHFAFGTRLGGQILFGFILWHDFLLYSNVRGAAITGHNSPVGCDFVTRASHTCGRLELRKRIVFTEPVANEKLDAARSGNLC